MTYTLTVTTKAKTNNVFHSVHETEDAAVAERRALLEKLNAQAGNPASAFVEVGRAVVRLADIESAEVSDDSVGFGLA
jgi:hypothetical protein